MRRPVWGRPVLTKIKRGLVMGAEKRLCDSQIRKCKPGKYFDGGGLILVSSEKSSKWVWRYTRHRKSRDMGLGKYPTVSLAQARQERDRCRALLYQGIDPIEQRRALDTSRSENLLEIAKGLQRIGEALQARANA